LANIAVCEPDLQRHVDKIRNSIDAGFDHMYMTQHGADQAGFLRFYQEQVVSRLKFDPAPMLAR
jgi:hypothetical protein